jgi:hypothetical protein
VLNPEIPNDGTVAAALGKRTAFDALTSAVQPIVRKARDASPAVTSALTDIPKLLGAQDVAPGADLTLLVATAGAYAAAITGWSDWADTKAAAQRVGIVHAAINGASVLAYQASMLLRVANMRGPARIVAFAGYAFISLGAYLGGELSTGMHLGVRHTASR